MINTYTTRFASLVLDTRELRAKRERIPREFQQAGFETVVETSRAFEKDLERATEGAGLGRLSRAWASRAYRNESDGSPAAIVYPKGTIRTRGAIRAHAYGARIRRPGGKFLAVPLPASGIKKRTETPAEYQFRTGNKLRFVPPAGKRPALLVLDDAVLSGKKQTARRNTARRAAAGRGNATIPIFVLLPTVDIKGSFSIEDLRRTHQAELRTNFLRRVAGLAKD